MTAQTVLSTIAIATTAIFILIFTADFTSTILQAWRAAAPVPQPQIEQASEPEPVPQSKFASIDWVQPEETSEETSEINIIELAKTRMPKSKPQPSIVTLPQTPEAEALEEWLSVAPSQVVSTPHPDYTKLTVKQLRQEAKIRNVKNSSAMAKKDLITALQAA